MWGRFGSRTPPIQRAKASLKRLLDLLDLTANYTWVNSHLNVLYLQS